MILILKNFIKNLKKLPHRESAYQISTDLKSLLWILILVSRFKGSVRSVFLGES